MAKRKLFLNLSVGPEKDYFIENLSMLLASGMDVLLALEAVKNETRSKRLKKIIDELKEKIDSGFPIWRALGETGLLSEHYVSLLKIGESSGRLPENLKLIVAQEQKSKIFKSKIRSAMMYPILVLSLTVVIGIGIAWFILPKLSQVFSSLKLDLPLITRWLIATGDFLSENGAWAIPAFVFTSFLGIYLVFFFSKTRHIGQFLLFHSPVVKNLIQQVELARFGYVLGTLFEAGLPIVEAIRSVEDSTILRNYKKFYAHLRDSIEQGNSFQKSFSLYKKKSRALIPVTVQQMIVSAEHSGTLPDTLIRIGDNFEAKTETTTKNLSTVLEPFLLVVVWLGVVAVALAVILPIYSLIGGLNQPQDQQSGPQVEGERAVAPVNDFVEMTIEPLPRLEIVLPAGARRLNVRQQPTDSSDIIGKVFSGEIFEYESSEQGWYEIYYEQNETGWVSGEYVSEIAE